GGVARWRDGARPTEGGHSAERRAGVPRVADASESFAGYRAGGPMDPGDEPAACYDQRGAGEGGGEFAVPNREHGIEVVSRVDSNRCGGSEFPGRSGGGICGGGKLGNERLAAMGGEAASAGDWAIYVAGELPGAGAGAGAGCDGARRAGDGCEF